MDASEERAQRPYIGYLEGIIGQSIVGWVADASGDSGNLFVKVSFDDRLTIEAKPDLFREDLKKANIGSGHHVFTVKIPDMLCDDGAHAVEVVVCARGKDDKLLDRQTLVFPSADAIYRRSFRDIHVELLFDREFYKRQVGLIFEDPLTHYERVGWLEGLNPHPLFATSHYVNNLNRPLRASNPLFDFLEYGHEELASTHPLFDTKHYIIKRNDIISANVHPLIHYLMYGKTEKFEISPFFNANYYRQQCKEKNIDVDDVVVHYLKDGYAFDLKPNFYFTPSHVRKINGENAQTKNQEPLTALLDDIRATSFGRPKNVTCAPDRRPGASVIILNYNRAMLVYQCIYYLTKNTDYIDYEIIIVDNGSEIEDFREITKISHLAKIIRSNINLGFGEANNLGVEAARSDLIVFLNNDAFVSRGWLPPLIDAINSPGVGASGPLFLYPDGKIQEAGAKVFADGTVHQRSKGLETSVRLDRVEDSVDYISAATLLIKRDLFIKIGGFDLIWDPAYYEDVDLCLKVKVSGSKVRFVPSSRVYHLEGSTSSDAKLGMSKVVSANRVKFINRWYDYVADGVAPAMDFSEVRSRCDGVGASEKPILALFTPFPIDHGGGEKFLLSFAHEMRNSHRCILFTLRKVSKIRLNNLAKDLDLSLGHVELMHWAHRGNADRPDIFIAMGNEILPHARAIGKNNFYICQFPFPMSAANYVSDWDNISGYDAFVVYSRFVEAALFKQKEVSAHLLPRVELLSPAVSQYDCENKDDKSVTKLLNVGRFHPGGHCKRQDVLIEAFREIQEQKSLRLELHLAGSLPSDAESRDYFVKLQELAKGLSVYFYPNCSISHLKNLYKDCGIYLHVTGIKDDVMIHPERFEHFGITIVEAMSAEQIPVVLGYGGPAEIVQDGVDGYHIFDRKDLVRVVGNILSADRDTRDRLRQRAKTKAKSYSYEGFRDKIAKIMLKR